MRARVAVVCLALVVLPLAGCLGTSGADGGGGNASVEASPENTEPQGNASAGDGAAPPSWSAGDWFGYERSGPWTVAGTSRLVVVEASSDGYVTALTDRAQERIDVYWSNDPLLGPLDPGLDATMDRTSTQPPAVLDWPLRDGRTWETTGYTWEFTFEATRDDAVETPEGPMVGYRISGTTSVNFTVEAAYVPALGALTSYRVVGPDDEPVFAYALTDLGSGFEGSAWTADRTVHVDNAFYTTESQVPPVVEFPVEDGDTDLVASVGQGSATVSATALLDPSGSPRHQAVTTPAEPGTFARVVVEDPAAGTWRWVVEAVGSGTDPASCGPDAPRVVLCGGVFLRTATLSLEEIQVGG